MATRLDERVERLRRRRSTADSTSRLSKGATVGGVGDSFPSRASAIDYVTRSADPVDQLSTDKSISERTRIETFLNTSLATRGFDVSFAYQGSLSNDTHIKVHSDIDLLVLTNTFFSVAPPLTVTSPYRGDPIADLEHLRQTCATLLDNRFYSATVDTGGAMCISIEDGSLSRKVDVVPANWLHTQAYRNDTSNMFHLGVYVLNNHKRERVANYPFAHNALVASRDSETGGTFRRLVRLVKSIRSDADNPPDISSYDLGGVPSS